ncbi:MAG: undecaprenyldiphospho-muramoylpentapeptide beta-N-acetylglucosaminyltransferase [Bacteroidia bacterium]
MIELKKVIISAGGTGGHIYPAVAVAQEIQKRFPKVEILFVGAKGRMEMEKVPKAGYKIEGLWISGLQRSLTIKNILFPVKVVSSVWHSLQILKKFKPQIVIGFGGYASGAMLYAATLKKIPTLIHEQNSYAGITNKILKNKVNTICVSYENMQNYFPANKIVLTGNPVRNDIVNNKIEKTTALKHFGIYDNIKPTLLVVGGSLGAKTINNCIFNNTEKLLKHCNIIWQKGKNFKQADDIKKQGLFVADFIYEMNYAYASADIVVSRAGALSIAELQIAAKPVILVPSPNVAEDHQTKNAMALVQKNAAIMVKDIEADEKLIDEIIRLANDKIMQKELSQNIKQMAIANAAELIVDEVIKLLV